MSEARDHLARYLEQRAEVGETPVVFDAPLERRTAEDGGGRQTMTGDGGRGGARKGEKARAATRGMRARDWRTDAPAIPGPGLVIPPPGKDLFTEDPLANATLDEVAQLVQTCTRCALHAARTNGVPGEGPADARLMVVGEGPGANEDAQGRPFVGRAGDLLNEILAAIECPREAVYIANVIKSRPPNNRKPHADEIEACIPYLHRQIEVIGPKVILAMGATAAESLLSTRGSLSSLRSKVHEFRGIPLIVTYHPAALMRNPNWKRPTWDDVRIARQLLER